MARDSTSASASTPQAEGTPAYGASPAHRQPATISGRRGFGLPETPVGPDSSVSGHEGRYEMREIANALLHPSRTGCQREYPPHDLPPTGAVKYYFYTWRDDGTDQVIHDLLRLQVRERSTITKTYARLATWVPSPPICAGSSIKDGRERRTPLFPQPMPYIDCFLVPHLPPGYSSLDDGTSECPRY